MRALTTVPGRTDTLRVDELPDPEPAAGELLVEGLAMGVCGTDHNIAEGTHGAAPEGRERLVLGHESLGRVRQAPDGSGFGAGDLVVGVVRRPDPVPCGACAHGHFDMCRNGRYSERGIKGMDGYGSTLWTVEAHYAVRLDASLERVGALLEPTSVVAKAWDQVHKVGCRSWFAPERALVTGAGPIGLLAALLGRQRGLEMHLLDRVASGPKPELADALGARYHTGDIADVLEEVRPDVVIEATGAAPVAIGAMAGVPSYGVVCLTGLGGTGRTLQLDAGELNRELVLDNAAVVGSVNANLDHYATAADALARAERDWLEHLITRRVALSDVTGAFAREEGDVKTVIDLTG